MKRYLYYPGCSVKGTGRAYEESLLALAERHDGADLVTPCNACYLVLLKTQHRLRENPEVRERVGGAMEKVGLAYRGTTRVRHPLDVLVNDFGLETVAEKVTDPLEGVKVAPYYGCQIVRPFALFDDQENPHTMDRILEAAGVTVVDYRYKTRCCGGSQTGTLPEIGLDLVRALLHEAREQGADVISTICPLCQFNLEAHQREIRRKWGIEPMPIVYFTQILGLALGVPARKLGLKRALVPAEPVLTKEVARVG
jgi:heterodisulfide reductase subunit B